MIGHDPEAVQQRVLGDREIARERRRRPRRRRRAPARRSAAASGMWPCSRRSSDSASRLCLRLCLRGIGGGRRRAAAEQRAHSTQALERDACLLADRGGA